MSFSVPLYRFSGVCPIQHELLLRVIPVLIALCFDSLILTHTIPTGIGSDLEIDLYPGIKGAGVSHIKTKNPPGYFTGRVDKNPELYLAAILATATDHGVGLARAQVDPCVGSQLDRDHLERTMVLKAHEPLAVTLGFVF